MRLLVTGGGTGGHIYPAVAIAQGFKKRHPEAELLYVGTNKGLEADIVPKANIPFTTVTVEGLQRKFSVQTLTFGVRLAKGLWEAGKVLEDFRPDVVVGTGGYVCGPIMFLAAQKGIPTLIHEQNAYPGITNKILSRFVDHVAVTFADALPYFPKGRCFSHTGLPVREELLRTDRATGLTNLKLDANKSLILITGGSRGARSINQAMVEVYRLLLSRDDVQVLHVTGQLDYDQQFSRLAEAGIDVKGAGNITIVPYLYNMADAMAAADLVICRAGATTLAEITAKGIPAILIPYPYAAENHQEYNALSLVKAGAAKMILDKDLHSKVLSEQVLELLNNGTLLKEMSRHSLELGRPGALQDILDILDKLVGARQNG